MSFLVKPASVMIFGNAGFNPGMKESGYMSTLCIFCTDKGTGKEHCIDLYLTFEHLKQLKEGATEALFPFFPYTSYEKGTCPEKEADVVFGLNEEDANKMTNQTIHSEDNKELALTAQDLDQLANKLAEQFDIDPDIIDLSLDTRTVEFLDSVIDNIADYVLDSGKRFSRTFINPEDFFIQMADEIRACKLDD